MALRLVRVQCWQMHICILIDQLILFQKWLQSKSLFYLSFNHRQSFISTWTLSNIFRFGRWYWIFIRVASRVNILQISMDIIFYWIVHAYICRIVSFNRAAYWIKSFDLQSLQHFSCYDKKECNFFWTNFGDRPKPPGFIGSSRDCLVLAAFQRISLDVLSSFPNAAARFLNCHCWHLGRKQQSWKCLHIYTADLRLHLYAIWIF